MKEVDGINLKTLWQDKKRHFGMPISFTSYKIVEKTGYWIKLFSTTGFLSKNQEETHIYRIDDISVSQSFFQRIFGVGTVKLWCQDASDEYLELISVREPYKLRDWLSEIIEVERTKKGFNFIEHSHA